MPDRVASAMVSPEPKPRTASMRHPASSSPTWMLTRGTYQRFANLAALGRPRTAWRIRGAPIKAAFRGSA